LLQCFMQASALDQAGVLSAAQHIAQSAPLSSDIKVSQGSLCVAASIAWRGHGGPTIGATCYGQPVLSAAFIYFRGPGVVQVLMFNSKPSYAVCSSAVCMCLRRITSACCWRVNTRTSTYMAVRRCCALAIAQVVTAPMQMSPSDLQSSRMRNALDWQGGNWRLLDRHSKARKLLWKEGWTQMRCWATVQGFSHTQLVTSEHICHSTTIFYLCTSACCCQRQLGSCAPGS
jgi:hypothetical protein